MTPGSSQGGARQVRALRTQDYAGAIALIGDKTDHSYERPWILEEIPLGNGDFIDRTAQIIATTYSGFETFGVQKSSLQKSMGRKVATSKGNLTTIDNGFILAGLKLSRAAGSVTDTGMFTADHNPDPQQLRLAEVLPDAT